MFETPAGVPSDELIPRQALRLSSSTVTSDPYTGILSKYWRNFTTVVPVSGIASAPRLLNSDCIRPATGFTIFGRRSFAKALSRCSCAAASGPSAAAVGARLAPARWPRRMPAGGAGSLSSRPNGSAALTANPLSPVSSLAAAAAARAPRGARRTPFATLAGWLLFTPRTRIDLLLHGQFAERYRHAAAPRARRRLLRAPTAFFGCRPSPAIAAFLAGSFDYFPLCLLRLPSSRASSLVSLPLSSPAPSLPSSRILRRLLRHRASAPSWQAYLLAVLAAAAGARAAPISSPAASTILLQPPDSGDRAARSERRDDRVHLADELAELARPLLDIVDRMADVLQRQQVALLACERLLLRSRRRIDDDAVQRGERLLVGLRRPVRWSASSQPFLLSWYAM